MAHEHHANSLPSELNAPLLLNSWRRKALVVGAIFAVLSIVLALLAVLSVAVYGVVSRRGVRRSA